MKAFATLICTVAALVSPAAADYNTLSRRGDAVVEREAAAPFSLPRAHARLTKRGYENVSVTTKDMDDGRSKVEIVVQGVPECYLIVSPNGTVHGYEGNGDEVNVEAILGDDDDNDNDNNDGTGTGHEKRTSDWLYLLAKLAFIIKKFGWRVILWFKCVGKWHRIYWCAPKLVRCAEHGRPPWRCRAAIRCIGKAAEWC